jgi:hypothetical protein
VRIPQADGSLYSLPAGADEEAFVMLSDILPTGFECGVLNGQVKPGDTVASERGQSVFQSCGRRSFIHPQRSLFERFARQTLISRFTLIDPVEG